ncbi:MAG: response regulator [Gemmatimonadetes bacterium]|nr:response regulator [Gemmatimonadota bacterium]
MGGESARGDAPGAERVRALASAAEIVGARTPAGIRDALERACRDAVPVDALLLMRYTAASHTFMDYGGVDEGIPIDPGPIPAAGTPAEWVVRERRSLVTLSSDDPSLVGALLTGTGRRSESAIRTPLLVGDRVIGILSVQSYLRDAYTPADVELVEALAALAAVALEGVRLAGERREAEEALRDSLRQLLQAQKMEAVGRLAGGVAHDFNNVLTAIRGYADLLKMDGEVSEENMWQVDEIRSASDRAAALTRQLLAFSRRQVTQPRSVSVNTAVAGMERLLRRLIGEDVRLHTVLAPEPGSVHVDPGHLDQVLMNLAVNARDAMPDGGTLLIATATVSIDAEEAVAHPGAVPGTYVRLSVSDTGTGIPEEVRARIFEPFFTTKEQGKGTGLGLSTVQGIVRHAGGHLRVASEPGRGTVFSVYLPLEAEEPEHLPAAGTAPPPSGSETILLVEDDQVVRRLLRTCLERQGYHVLDAPTGAEALRAAEECPGGVDLLLTDVVMPGGSGRTLARRMRERHPRLRVVYMSGYTDDTIVRHGVLESGSEFVQKPVSPDALGMKIRAVLDSPIGGS